MLGESAPAINARLPRRGTAASVGGRKAPLLLLFRDVPFIGQSPGFGGSARFRLLAYDRGHEGTKEDGFEPFRSVDQVFPLIAGYLADDDKGTVRVEPARVTTAKSGFDIRSKFVTRFEIEAQPHLRFDFVDVLPARSRGAVTGEAQEFSR